MCLNASLHKENIPANEKEVNKEGSALSKKNTEHSSPQMLALSEQGTSGRGIIFKQTHPTTYTLKLISPLSGGRDKQHYGYREGNCLTWEHLQRLGQRTTK